MTLINSCYPKSFLHLIFLLSTCAITATTIPEERQNSFQLDASRESSAGHGNLQSNDDTSTTSFRGYDRIKSDNKKFDETVFEFKTDVNKLSFHSKSFASRRFRRDAIQKSTTDSTVMKVTANEVADEDETISENLILNLSFGNLTDFHVNFTNTISERIEAVNLSHNALLHFNSSKLTKLKVLDMSHNKLNGSYNLLGHEFLRTLDVSFNSLSSFSCVGCESLVSLNLSDNQLINITLIVSVEHQHPLQFLDLSSNELTDIDSHLFDNKSNLSDLIVSCNRMRIINKDLFRQLRSLRRLDLSFNDISVIENEAFSNLENLQILDLSNNRLHIASIEALRAVADLARLSLASNIMLRNALRGFAVTWSILELDYSHVGLCQVPDSLAQSVRILNLYGNSLNIICSGDFDSYPLLHKLVLSNNNLTSIEDDALGRLEMLTILHLDNNQLTQIPLSLPSSLMKLFIQANHIADIRPDDLANLNNLELLDFSNNRIIYMPQLALPSLITLSVKMNELENVQHQMLKTCPNLRHLFNVGNPIKCADDLLEFGEICIDDSQQALSNKYINDDIDYNQNDVKRKEKHLNSQSYFHRMDAKGSLGCQKQRRRNDIKGSNFTADADVDGMETVPNCWSEKEKLITPLILTNNSTTSKATTTTETSNSRRQETAASNDNKFTQQTTIAPMRKHSRDNKTAQSNERNLSNSTIRMIQTKDEKNDVKTKNEKSSTLMTTTTATTETNDKVKKPKVKKKKQNELGINVANKEIKRLNGSANGEKSLSNDSQHQQQQSQSKVHPGVVESNLMKSNQIKSDENENRRDDGKNENHSKTRTLIAQIENPQLVASEKAINRNLIDNVQKGGDYVGKTVVIQSKSELISEANKNKAIKDNDGRSLAARPTNSAKSIDNVHTPAAKVPALKDNKSNNERPLHAIISAMARGKSGNEGSTSILEATDHHHQHSPINHTMEKWNDVRSENINHPGLLVIITVSVGFFFIFTLLYVYRCDFIKSARRRNRGSFESINEGRDVLNDNFNEETRSFTIESYSNSQSCSSIQGPSVVNQNDLLPMDILNSSVSGSTLDPPPHISMHLW